MTIRIDTLVPALGDLDRQVLLALIDREADDVLSSSISLAASEVTRRVQLSMKSTAVREADVIKSLYLAGYHELARCDKHGMWSLTGQGAHDLDRLLKEDDIRARAMEMLASGELQIPANQAMTTAHIHAVIHTFISYLQNRAPTASRPGPNIRLLQVHAQEFINRAIEPTQDRMDFPALMKSRERYQQITTR